MCRYKCIKCEYNVNDIDLLIAHGRTHSDGFRDTDLYELECSEILKRNLEVPRVPVNYTGG